MLPDFSFYLPLPVGDGAIAQAKPDAQNEPRKGRNYHTNKVKPPGSAPNLAEKVKADKRKVDYSKK